MRPEQRFNILMCMLAGVLLVQFIMMACISLVSYQVEALSQADTCTATTQYYERAYPVPEPTDTF